MRTLVTRMEKAQALLPGEGHIQDLQKGVNCIQAYARQHGVNITYQHRLPRPDLASFGVPPRLAFPMPKGVAISLDQTYMRRYHEEINQVPTTLSGGSPTGPDHMVTLLALTEAHATFFDPDRSLKNGTSLQSYPPGTVRLDLNTFDAHYNLGEVPTEAVIVETLYAKAKAKAAPKLPESQQKLRLEESK